jgi:5-methyltetrahydrofolate--homocysteine methyltransferase
MAAKQSVLETIYQNIIDGFVVAVTDGVYEALQTGHTPTMILNTMIAAMNEVSLRFEDQTCFVPETLIACRAMKEGMALLKPALHAANASPLGKIVIGTVEGDIHDIGKNLVGLMFEGAGFEVIDLGVETQPQQFVEAARTHQPDFIGMSSLLTTTMFHMSRTIKALEQAGLRRQVKIIIGGAPVTQKFANLIGADIYASDAASGVRKAKKMLG